MKYVLKSTNTERLQNQSDFDPDIITEVFFLCTKSVRDLSEKRTNLQAEIRTKKIPPVQKVMRKTLVFICLRV